MDRRRRDSTRPKKLFDGGRSRKSQVWNEDLEGDCRDCVLTC